MNENESMPSRLSALLLLWFCASAMGAENPVATAPSTSSTTAPSAAKTAPPLTVDATIGELLDNPAALEVLKRQVPVIASSPQIRQARGQSLRSIAVYAPTLLTEAKLNAIDEELARTPGAVKSPNAPRPAPPAVDPRAAFELRTVSLWEGRAPGSTGDRPQDKPTLTIIGIDGAPAAGTAVIVAPGGAYMGLASGHEGRQVADWFAAHGVTAFVLTYRLIPYGYHHPIQLQDAQRAIRWVRAHSADYGVDPQRIGMIGFSAGGHLTAMAATLFDNGDPQAADPVDRVSSRPDFAILGYPAIDLTERSLKHIGVGVAGPKPDAATLRELAPAQNVSPQTPPTFIFHTSTDETVPARNATLFYDALRAANVPVELHIFAEGRHGLGFAMTDPALSAWPMLLQTWLQGRGLIGPDIGAR
jgi:acetyl esterase/lipase